MGNRKRRQWLGQTTGTSKERLGAIPSGRERATSPDMATQENWVKWLWLSLAVAVLVIAGAWALTIAYPPQSDEDIAHVYQYRDWIGALGRGDFAEAERIQAQR